jgi:hypothetical protein
MKKILLLAAVIALPLAFTACNTTRATITSPNGQVQKIKNSRFAWSSEEYDFGFDTNGVWHARATKSNPDAATVQAAFQLASGLLQLAQKAP